MRLIIETARDDSVIARMPVTLRGHALLACMVRDQNSAIVLVDYDGQYVVGAIYHHTNGTDVQHVEWNWGDYFDDLASAQRRLFERATRTTLAVKVGK